MKIQNIAIVFFGLIVGLLISYNLIPEKTPHHTSTVSGSSGDLNCSSSCVRKEK
jgi:uncharacterized membrane protein